MTTPWTNFDDLIDPSADPDATALAGSRRS
jgi:hypothetical protein